MTLLAQSFGTDSLAIVSNLSDRTEAIKLAGDLLQKSGRARAEYVTSMIEAVEKYGPYIVIAPGIALAHGKPEDGVIENGLSLVVMREPLAFGHGENDPVELVFGLAATDHTSHLGLMAELATFLGDPEKVNSLLQAGDLVQLRTLLA
jgi:ascorbate PTS system EIIA or EIIAB component